MWRLLFIGSIFYAGYRLGNMTPEERQNLLTGVKSKAKSAIDEAQDFIADESENLNSIRPVEYYQ